MKPLVYGGVIYVGTEQGSLYALTVEKGERLWQFQADAGIRAGAKIGGDRIVFGDTEGNVYAVDEAQGELVWKFEHPDEMLPDLSIDDERVYVTYLWGQVIALDIRDGSLTWWFDTGNVIYSPAVEREGSIYVSVQAQGTYALDAETGEQRWLNGRTGSARFITADDEKLFLGLPQGYAVALDRAKGEVLWYRLVNHRGVKSFGAISTESLLVATWNSEMVSLSKDTGEFNWISKIGDEETVGTPTIVAVSDDVAYVGWDYGSLYAVDLAIGSIMGTGVTEEFVGLSTTAALGFVYAGSDDSQVVAAELAVSGPVSDAWSYAPAPAAAPFEPLTPSEFKSSLEKLAKRDSIANDDRVQQLVMRIAETGYHLLAKRSFAQDAIETEFDADICDEMSGVLGWRVRSFILLICDDLDSTYALTVVIHESGHALEEAIDPLPEAIDIPEDTDISLLSFSEARAQIFEAAVARQLAAYVDLDVETKRESFVAEYAALMEEACQSNAKIFFADEAHFRADAELRGKWVLRGEPALVDSSSPRYGEKASYYSAVCLETGEVEWMELEGNSNSGTSAAFLEQLRERHSGRLNVIWDNGRGTARISTLMRPSGAGRERRPRAICAWEPGRQSWNGSAFLTGLASRKDR